MINFLLSHGIENIVGFHPNQYKLIPKIFSANEVDQFNEIYQKLKDSDLDPIIRTPSGSIKQSLVNSYCWDYIESSIGARITVLLGGSAFVFKIGIGGSKKKEPKTIYPNKAFQILSDKFAEDGIDLNDYTVDNGTEIKAQIKPAPVLMDDAAIKTVDQPGLRNCNHIDFHNSFPAGLANTHPEMRPTLEYFYNQRKLDPENSAYYKSILNYAIGFMQTTKFGFKAKLANLSKDAIDDNNKRIFELSIQLRLAGRQILGFNSDGIWYRGAVYHGEGEGPNLGQWSNDHVNCTFRAKSSGAYEFIENGTYHAVLRGNSTYDREEPDRTKWEWGDIYKGSTTHYEFDENIGIIAKND